MTITYTYQSTLTVIECCRCHMDFGMPIYFEQQARDDESIWFYCPDGHKQHFPGDTKEQKLQRQLNAAWANARAAEERAERERRSAIAQKGHATRLRRRAAAGVCPCCTRSFQNLARHMSGQHPEFVEAVKP